MAPPAAPPTEEVVSRTVFPAPLVVFDTPSVTPPTVFPSPVFFLDASSTSHQTNTYLRPSYQQCRSLLEKRSAQSPQAIRLHSTRLTRLCRGYLLLHREYHHLDESRLVIGRIKTSAMAGKYKRKEESLHRLKCLSVEHAVDRTASPSKKMYRRRKHST